MITTRLYLDTRATGGADVEAPLKLQITKRGKTALLGTGVRLLPSQWDKQSQRIVKHPSKSTLNTYVLKLVLKVEDMLQEMVLSGRAAELSATEIKNEVEEKLIGKSRTLSLGAYYADYVSRKSKPTALIYNNNLKVVIKFDADAPSRSLRAFRPQWAESLADWLEKHYSGNTRRQVLANLNAVFNQAVEEKLVEANPVKGIKVGYVMTRKRNLSQKQIRTLWNCEPRGERERVALDLFKFSFLTIATNTADIALLAPGHIFNGRIDYDRLKTGKHYSIKIVPELEPLLTQYADDSMLFTPFRKYRTYQSLVTNSDQALARLSRRLGLPGISMYWARHTWATLAAELDISIDVISSALGHSHGAKVTLVYINQDQKKVDDAHRRVIDFALYDEIKEK